MSFLARRRQPGAVSRLERRATDADKTVARLEDQVARLNDERKRLSMQASAREEWLVENAPSVRKRFALERELWWREHQRALQAEVAMPSYLSKAVGERPGTPSERAAWHQAVEAIESYRERWDVTDPRSALGNETARGPQSKERAELTKQLESGREPSRSQERDVRVIERSLEL